jgi:hypothetical protein
MVTPRERVETALLGRWADRIPFTTYYNKFFTSRVERELRNEGMCIIDHRVTTFVVETPDLVEENIHYRGEDGIMCRTHVVRTPEGTISEVYKLLPEHPCIPGQLWPWHSEYFFKGPEDYRPIEYMIRSRRYAPNYEFYQRAQEEAGGDVLFIQDLSFTPLQEIIVNLMGIEQFSLEWHSRRDDVLKLYQALTEDRRKFYPLVAESPALMVYGDANVSPEVVGLDRFVRYVLPHYDEFAEILHEKGKLLIVHFDANTRLLASAIAGSHLDVVEAFTPYPNGDMTVAEARTAWQDKVLWINFPSSIHLESPERIEEVTRGILQEAKPGDRFLVGITEAVPTDLWQASFRAISRVLREEGELPLR